MISRLSQAENGLKTIRNVAFGANQSLTRYANDPFIGATSGRGRELPHCTLCDVLSDDREIT